MRIHGELISAGFNIEIVDGAARQGVDGESRDWLEQLAARRGADAVVAMMGNGSPDSVEVWVVDKVTGKSVVRRIPFKPKSARDSETLAIRAIELLRASFLEIDLSTSTRSNTPPPTVIRFMEMERKTGRPERFGAEVGGAAIMSLDGVDPAFLPVVRFDWALRSWLVVQTTVAGMGTRPSVHAEARSAQVAQAFALLGASYRFSVGKRLSPFVSLSTGVLHTSVEGRADSPYKGLQADLWSFLLDGGFGVGVPLRDRFHLSLAAHVQIAEPFPAIRFAGKVVATSARPNLLLTLTIGAWL